MSTLYVIGNGFDLHHGMKTRYTDFGAHLKCTRSDIYDLVEQYFPMEDNTDDFWNHFEERLADFDADSLVDNSEELIVSYNADDWSDAYHHDYAYELNSVVEMLSSELVGSFAQWIRTIAIPTISEFAAPAARIDTTARFLNFNYTSTLQRLYRVPDDRVWHIHGAAERPVETLVLGHGWQPSQRDRRAEGLDPQREDIRVIDGAKIIDHYFDKTFKPTAKIITENASWFAQLADVDDVRVLGHSMSDVDLPYLEKIARSVSDSASWRISYHGDPSWSRARAARFAPTASSTFWPLPCV